MNFQAFLGNNLTTVAIDPTNINVIKLAASSLGLPLATACQLTVERQPNTPHNITQVTSAPHLASPSPLPSKIPQATDSPPNSEPDMRAVAAVVGLEA